MASLKARFSICFFLHSKSVCSVELSHAKVAVACKCRLTLSSPCCGPACNKKQTVSAGDFECPSSKSRALETQTSNAQAPKAELRNLEPNKAQATKNRASKAQVKQTKTCMRAGVTGTF